MSTLDEQFQKAQDVLKDKAKFAKLNTKQKLTVYALAKQAANGKNTAPQPKKTDMVAYYKWTAWDNVSKLSKEEAKKQFVDFVKSVFPDSKL
jgi:acyl-CoA-binding protein